jgi:putative ABC transport system ATP-binding protein
VRQLLDGGSFGRCETHIGRRLLKTFGFALLLTAQLVERSPTGNLSVGQQQRVAVARALIGGPGLLIADEPTSALDTNNRDVFLRLLLAECTRHGTGVVFVSHDMGLARHFDRAVSLGDCPPSQMVA